MASKFILEGTKSMEGDPMREGYYFYGEDESMYGPYATKELCENAFMRYCRDLDRKDLEDYYRAISIPSKEDE